MDFRVNPLHLKGNFDRPLLGFTKNEPFRFALRGEGLHFLSQKFSWGVRVIGVYTSFWKFGQCKPTKIYPWVFNPQKIALAKICSNLCTPQKILYFFGV